MCRSRERNICSSSGGAQEKGKIRMKLSVPPKLVEKLVWVPVILFCKIFIHKTEEERKLVFSPKLVLTGQEFDP